MSSLSSDLVMAWSYVLSTSALRQPRSSTSASSARSRSAGLLNSSRTFLTRNVVWRWRIVCGVMLGRTRWIAFWALASSREMVLRLGEQAFEDDAKAGVLELA